MKDEIRKLKKQGLSHKEIAKQLNCAKSTVSYHCQDLKEYNSYVTPTWNLTTEQETLIEHLYCRLGIKTPEISDCLRIPYEDVKKFCRARLSKKGFRYNPNFSPYERLRFRRQKVKLLSVLYLGGKCNKCGAKLNLECYDIHHANGDKSFNLSYAAQNNFPWKTVKTELDKCELLCVHCHRQIHASYESEFQETLDIYYKLVEPTGVEPVPLDFQSSVQ